MYTFSFRAFRSSSIPYLFNPLSLLFPVGPVIVSKSPPSLSEMEKSLLEVKAGGIGRPADCVARHRVAIIIPFRDRPQHLQTLLYNLHPVLLRQQIDYQIFVVEQEGEWNSWASQPLTGCTSISSSLTEAFLCTTSFSVTVVFSVLVAKVFENILILLRSELILTDKTSIHSVLYWWLIKFFTLLFDMRFRFFFNVFFNVVSIAYNFFINKNIYTFA